MMMILMMIMMTKPYDYDDHTNAGDHVHKNDSYIAAGATPGASVPCSLFRYISISATALCATACVRVKRQTASGSGSGVW